MLIGLITILIFAAIVLISSQLLPSILEIFQKIQDKKVEKAEDQLDKMFIQVKQGKLFFFYTVTPLILGAGAFLLLHNLLVAVIIGVIGLFLPTVVIKNLGSMRRARFQTQLVDAIMLLASSLKAGLSLVQAFEVLVEEMPAPMSQEIGLVVRENKVGIPLEDALRHLNRRMNVEELQMLVNSILVARETGGDVTKVFSRLAVTIRDNRKLKESVKTLTLQGRLQGIIMSLLPIVFIFGIFTFNPHHFDIMLQNETGKMLLVIAVILQVAGVILIRIFSTVKL